MPAGRERCMVPGSFGGNSELKTFPFGLEGAAHGQERERDSPSHPQRERPVSTTGSVCPTSPHAPHMPTLLPRITHKDTHVWCVGNPEKPELKLLASKAITQPCSVAPPFLNTLSARTPVARPLYTRTHIPHPAPLPYINLETTSRAFYLAPWALQHTPAG